MNCLIDWQPDETEEYHEKRLKGFNAVVYDLYPLMSWIVMTRLIDWQPGETEEE